MSEKHDRVTAALEGGAIITVEETRHRVRHLPIAGDENY